MKGTGTYVAMETRGEKCVWNVATPALCMLCVMNKWQTFFLSSSFNVTYLSVLLFGFTASDLSGI